MISKDKIEKLEEITIEDFKELMGNLISFLEEFYKLKYCSTVVYMVPRA